MKKWIVVALVLLLVTMWWSRRREGYVVTDLHSAVNIYKPGGMLLLPSDPTKLYYGFACLATPTVDSFNSVVDTLNTLVTPKCTTYTSVPTLTGDESTKSYTDRMVLRASAMWPVLITILLASYESQMTSVTSATISNAALILQDIGTGSVTNINSILTAAGKSPYTDVTQFNTVFVLPPQDDSSKYVMGYMYYGFKTWLTGITFDMTFNPTTYKIAASGVCYQNGPSCTTGTICSGGTCVTATCANGGVTCPSGQTCVGSSCQTNCESGGSYCTDSTKKCFSGACQTPNCGSNYCVAPQICVNGTCQTPNCGTNYCDSSKVCVSGACQTPNCGSNYCDSSKVCVNGTCQTPNCGSNYCGTGKVCVPGNTCVTLSTNGQSFIEQLTLIKNSM